MQREGEASSEQRRSAGFSTGWYNIRVQPTRFCFLVLVRTALPGTKSVFGGEPPTAGQPLSVNRHRRRYNCQVLLTGSQS